MENTQQNYLDTSYNYVVGQLCALGDPLPESGVALDIVKRVVVAVAASFAYLALAFCKVVQYLWTSLVGRAGAVQNENIDLVGLAFQRPNANRVEIPEEEYKAKYSDFCDRFVGNLFDNIVMCCPATNIHSIRTFTHKFHPRTLSSTQFTKLYSGIFHTAGNLSLALYKDLEHRSYAHNYDLELRIESYVIIKEKNGKIHAVSIKSKSLDSNVFEEGNRQDIDLNHRDEAIKQFLEGEGFTYTRQFDPNGELNNPNINFDNMKCD